MKRKDAAETVALALTMALAVAFVVSFAAGLGRPGPAAPPGTGAELQTPAVDPPRELRGRVEILNASTRSGLARDATGRLRDAGFDVVYFGNAALVPDSSRVIDRMDRPDVARAIASELGISRIITMVDSSLYLDASVILGTDWVAKKKD